MKDDVGKFDPPFFSMTESEAATLDPQQRLQLECAYEAFESGISDHSGIEAVDFDILQHLFRCGN